MIVKSGLADSTLCRTAFSSDLINFVFDTPSRSVEPLDNDALKKVVPKLPHANPVGPTKPVTDVPPPGGSEQVVPRFNTVC